MNCVLTHSDHCLSLALTRLAATRSDIRFDSVTPSGSTTLDIEAVFARAPRAVVVPPLAHPEQREPAEVYAHCDQVEALAEACRMRDVPLVWCVSDATFEDGAEGVIDETAMPSPRDEALRRLVQAGEQCRRQPRHVVLRLGPLFALKGSDAWLGPLIETLMQGERVAVPQDVILCPTSVAAAARALLGMLLQLDSGASGWGTYHLAGGEPVSVYTFTSVVRTQLATRIEGAGRTSQLGELRALNQHHDSPLRRVLDCRRLLDVFGVHQKSWRTELDLMLDAWSRDDLVAGGHPSGSHEEAADA
ncbi:sugar nucleotide-binding protein [Salinicola aestuarinus]|uniref:sugar nucleotide-binding protein n=1 Tax=Salinicola aestuarinus TaxID=1949082 RepID=UPI000DA2037C|nr:sugar nucleotide-binding protein [Salinicola aestuarinus]